MASIRRRETANRTVSWQVRWYAVDGSLRSRSFTTQREARAYKNKVDAIAPAGRPRGAGSQLTLGSAIEAWIDFYKSKWRSKTLSVNVSAVKALKPLANTRVDRLTPDAVTAVTDPLGPHMGRQAINAVKGALKLAQSRGFETIPATVALPSPRPPKGSQRALTGEEVELLAKTIGPPHGDVVKLLAYTGLRVRELAGLEIRDYDEYRQRLNIRRSAPHNGNTELKSPAAHRSIPVIPEVRRIIERRIEDRPEAERHPYAPIVQGPRGGTWNSSNWRRDSGWSSALNVLGLGRVRLHDLRHTFASLVRRSNADIYVLQKVLGHEQIATTLDTYGHLYDDEIDDLGAALTRSLNAQSSPYGQNMAP